MKSYKSKTISNKIFILITRIRGTKHKRIKYIMPIFYKSWEDFIDINFRKNKFKEFRRNINNQRVLNKSFMTLIYFNSYKNMKNIRYKTRKQSIVYIHMC